MFTQLLPEYEVMACCRIPRFYHFSVALRRQLALHCQLSFFYHLALFKVGLDV
jgi:hypothetical protein